MQCSNQRTLHGIMIFSGTTQDIYLPWATIMSFTSPHLSSSRSVAHKAALLFFHLSLSLARALTSSQDFQPAIALSFSTVRRQVVLGWPTFLLPIGVQVSAVGTVVFSGHPKNMSQKSPSPSLYFYTHPRTSCSFVKLINRYYARPKYTQAYF